MVVYSLVFPKHKHFNFLEDEVYLIFRETLWQLKPNGLSTTKQFFKNSLPQKRTVFLSSNFLAYIIRQETAYLKNVPFFRPAISWKMRYTSSSDKHFGS
jgi:hypothetical protein